jgi:hypothetical protein
MQQRLKEQIEIVVEFAVEIAVEMMKTFEREEEIGMEIEGLDEIFDFEE